MAGSPLPLPSKVSDRHPLQPPRFSGSGELPLDEGWSTLPVCVGLQDHRARREPLSHVARPGSDDAERLAFDGNARQPGYCQCRHGRPQVHV